MKEVFNGFLLVGIMFYYDILFFEGFFCYKIYVNIDCMLLLLENLLDLIMIVLLDVAFFCWEVLLKFFKNCFFIREDFDMIFSMDYLIKDEIKEVFREFVVLR